MYHKGTFYHLVRNLYCGELSVWHTRKISDPKNFDILPILFYVCVAILEETKWSAQTEEFVTSDR